MGERADRPERHSDRAVRGRQRIAEEEGGTGHGDITSQTLNFTLKPMVLDTNSVYKMLLQKDFFFYIHYL